MKISIASMTSDHVLQLEVAGDTTVDLLKTLIEVETRIPAASQEIRFNNQLLLDNQRLGDAGVKENDFLQLTQGRGPQGRPSLATIPPEVLNNPVAFTQYIQANPELMQQLLATNPQLAQAVVTGPEAVTQFFNQQMQARRQQQLDEMKRVAELNANPFDAEAQRRIEEAIRLRNVQENMEHAIEHNPESFARVVMLYVPCKVNSMPLIAFVDSGAQSTIMSESCARRCNLMRLIDTRFAGLAKGVGTAKILGRVHAAPLQMGSVIFQCSFTVIENQSIDLLFGLDQLKHHQVMIDLKENVMHIQGEKIPFLAEKDLPRSVRMEDHGQDGGVSSPTASSSSAVPPQPAIRPPVVAARPPSQSNIGAPPVVVQQPRPAAFPEGLIQQLCALGFPRESAVRALQQSNGNPDVAAGLLFGGFR